MFALKSTQYLVPSLRHASQARRFVSGDVQSRASGVKLDSKSKNADRVADEGNKNDNWSKDEKKFYEHPVRSTIDKFADKVEHAGADSSTKFSASKDFTDRAAHLFADPSSLPADRAAHTGEKLRDTASSASGGLSAVSQRIAKYAAASSGATYTSGKATSIELNLEPEGPTMTDKIKDVAKHGMDAISGKMTNVGQSIAGTMKMDMSDTVPSATTPTPNPLMAATDKLKQSKDAIVNSIPSADSVKETVKHAMPSTDSIKGMADSIKSAIPSTNDIKKSAENLLHKVTDAMPSMDSVKGMASSVKDSMPSTDSVKQSMPSTDSVKGMASSVKDSMPSTDSVKGMANSVKDSMPSMDSVKGMANSVKDSMPSTNDMKQSAQNLKESISNKAADAKDTANAAAESASGVFDSFKQGINQMKEAMKPIVDYSSDKIKAGAQVAAEKIPPIAQSIKDTVVSGASVAAEKIPPMAQSIKEKASDVMKSDTAESIKETVSQTAKGAYVKAKDAANTAWSGPKETDKMEIKENTKTVSRDQLKAKPQDQAMSSSDTK